MVYEWKVGSHIRASAQAAGEMCEELASRGQLSPKALLDANRAEGTPLHNEFEWNDSEAAERYRESQAAHIIRCVATKQFEGQTENQVRAFVHVTALAGEYKPVNVALQVPNEREVLLRECIRKLRNIKREYETLSELTPIFDAIEQLAS